MPPSDVHAVAHEVPFQWCCHTPWSLPRANRSSLVDEPETVSGAEVRPAPMDCQPDGCGGGGGGSAAPTSKSAIGVAPASLAVSVPAERAASRVRSSE